MRVPQRCCVSAYTGITASKFRLWGLGFRVSPWLRISAYSGNLKSRHIPMPTVHHGVSTQHGPRLPGEKTSLSRTVAMPPSGEGTLVSARWIFRYLATSSPLGLNEGQVLYISFVDESISGMEPGTNLGFGV